jgi:hypothetical protein
MKETGELSQIAHDIADALQALGKIAIGTATSSLPITMQFWPLLLSMGHWQPRSCLLAWPPIW